MRLIIPVASEGSLINRAFEAIGQAYYGVEEQAQIQSDQGEYGLESPSLDEDEKTSFKAVVTTGKLSSPNPVYEAFWLLVENIWLVWLGVAIVMLIRRITIYRGFVEYVKVGIKPVSDTELLDRIADIGKQMGVRKAVELCINPLVSSPLLIGFTRPTIVIPSINISKKDFYYIVLHELTHYKRLDMFYKWLVQIVICLHWFNPLVYLMGTEINKACDFSCDETIAKGLSKKDAQDYCETLLEAMASRGQYKEALASVTLSENKKILKERLSAIMNFKGKSKAVAITTLLLTIILLGGAAIMGAFTASTEKPILQGESSIIDTEILDSEQINIITEINNGGIQFFTNPQNKITADFDPEFYDVDILFEDDEWRVTITGKKTSMGAVYVSLYIPEDGCNVNANVTNGSLLYDLPETCNNSLSITANNSSIKFSSLNGYENYNISVTATNHDFFEYGHFNYPRDFTQDKDAIFYTNGTGENVISVFLVGYTNVDF